MWYSVIGPLRTSLDDCACTNSSKVASEQAFSFPTVVLFIAWIASSAIRQGLVRSAPALWRDLVV